MQSDEARTAGSPKLYTIDTLEGLWIAEGSDGFLYRVPDEPGGWKRRQRYDGQQAQLVPVPGKEAREVAQRLEGDFGAATIAWA